MPDNLAKDLISPQKILIVEDEADHLSLLTDIFTLSGYLVTPTSNGKDAVEKLANQEFSVVVTDIMMPEMNGLELLEKIKALNNDLPVIVITGHGNIDLAVEAMKKGAFDFLKKPVSIKNINEKITKAIDRKNVIDLRIENKVELVQHQRNLIVSNNQLKMELLKQTNRLEKMKDDLYGKITFLEAINQVSTALCSVLDINDLFQLIVETSMSCAKAEKGSLMIVDQKKKELVVKVALGVDSELIKDKKKNMVDGITGWVCKNKKPLIIKDLRFDTRFSFQFDDKYTTTSLISLPILFKNKLLGVINITNKMNKEPFTTDDLHLMTSLAQNAAIAIENARLYDDLHILFFDTVRSLAAAIDAKDPYTHGHSERVSEYAVVIAQQLKLSPEVVKNIRLAGLLHDIGKIGISEKILLKPDILTPREFETIKKHPEVGARILKNVEALEDLIPALLHHHERWDGTGYVLNLKGEEIPIEARILSVADAFDAITTNRPYRNGLKFESAIEEIKRCCGSQFDTSIVEAFIKTIH
jgi:putative nucleotidyltransferase with HDIG domain